MTDQSDLSAFLQAASGRPFSWGSADCLMLLADWVLLRRGVDPGQPWRGRDRTAFVCTRIVSRAGGIVPLLDTAFAAVGLRRTADPVPGDVGAVDMPAGPTGAILGPRGWVCRTAKGLICAPAPVLAAWRV